MKVDSMHLQWKRQEFQDQDNTLSTTLKELNSPLLMLSLEAALDHLQMEDQLHLALDHTTIRVS